MDSSGKGEHPDQGRDLGPTPHPRIANFSLSPAAWLAMPALPFPMGPRYPEGTAILAKDLSRVGIPGSDVLF